MELRELKIEISEEFLESLKKASEKQNTTQENLAKEILEKALKPSNEKEKKRPSVALVKETSGPEIVAPTKHEFSLRPSLHGDSLNPRPGMFSGASSSFQQPTRLSPEKLRRKKELEDQMKEVSLLIETAESEAKKEEYLQDYAGLAAEIEALL